MSAAAENRAAKPDKEQPREDAAQQPTNDPKLSDPEKTPGSGMVPDNAGDAPTG